MFNANPFEINQINTWMHLIIRRKIQICTSDKWRSELNEDLNDDQWNEDQMMGANLSIKISKNYTAHII